MTSPAPATFRATLEAQLAGLDPASDDRRRLEALLGHGDEAPFGFELVDRALHVPTSARVVALHGCYTLWVSTGDDQVHATVLRDPAGGAWALLEVRSHTAPGRCELRRAPGSALRPQVWLFGATDEVVAAQLRVGAPLVLPAILALPPAHRVPVDVLPPAFLSGARRVLAAAAGRMVDAPASWADVRPSLALVFDGPPRAHLDGLLRLESEKDAVERAADAWEQTWVYGDTPLPPTDDEPPEDPPAYVGWCLSATLGDVGFDVLQRDGAARLEVWASVGGEPAFLVDPLVAGD